MIIMAGGSFYEASDDHWPAVEPLFAGRLVQGISYVHAMRDEAGVIPIKTFTEEWTRELPSNAADEPKTIALIKALPADVQSWIVAYAGRRGYVDLVETLR